MRGWWKWMVVPGMLAGVVCATTLTAQAAPAAGSEVCSLATNEEFQKAHGVNPAIGIIPDTPQATEMVWGPHCDYSGGSIDLFTKKSPSAELERVLTLTTLGTPQDLSACELHIESYHPADEATARFIREAAQD